MSHVDFLSPKNSPLVVSIEASKRDLADKNRRMFRSCNKITSIIYWLSFCIQNKCCRVFEYRNAWMIIYPSDVLIQHISSINTRAFLYIQFWDNSLSFLLVLFLFVHSAKCACKICNIQKYKASIALLTFNHSVIKQNAVIVIVAVWLKTWTDSINQYLPLNLDQTVGTKTTMEKQTDQAGKPSPKKNDGKHQRINSLCSRF